MFRPLSASFAAAALAGLVAAPPLAAAPPLGIKIGNDLGLCASGKGPAVRLEITGLKSAAGNLFVRTYHARSSDWLKSRRYIHRIESRPRQGTATVCVPLPAPGDYAITVQHDINGNRDTDLSVDGAGMSNNPKIATFMGLIPRPPGVEKARFSAGTGITPLRIAVQYR